MGVFSNQNQAMETGIGKICKRDYEADIARLKAQVTVSSCLLLAVEDYCEIGYQDGNATWTLNGLIGGLTREIKMLNKNVASLQEEWEDSK